MTKFEEEAIKEAKKSKFIMNSYDGEFTASDIGLNIKLGRVAFNFPWLEFARNWHSDEEFQELLDKYSNLNDNYEKEVIRSSKLESQITGLKSQLQQQALPVVPECVGEWIEKDKNYGRSVYDGLHRLDYEAGEIAPREVAKWVFDNKKNLNLFTRAWLDGYQVEKPQLFYLKNKITGNVLVYDESPELSEVSELFATGGEFELENYTFTKQEINSMETGSYELVPVEDGE